MEYRSGKDRGRSRGQDFRDYQHNRSRFPGAAFLADDVCRVRRYGFRSGVLYLEAAEQSRRQALPALSSGPSSGALMGNGEEHFQCVSVPRLRLAKGVWAGTLRRA